MKPDTKNLFPTVTQAAREFWHEINPDYNAHITRGIIEGGQSGLSAVLTTTNGLHSRVLLRIPIRPRRSISPHEMMLLAERLSNGLCHLTYSENIMILHSKSALPETELYSPIKSVCRCPDSTECFIST